MNAQEKIRRAYMVTVHQMDETSYGLSYVPRGLMHLRGPGGAPARTPRFKATAQVRNDEILVSWEEAPSDPEASQFDFDQDVRGRVKALRGWIKRLITLVSRVRGWAEELGWATRNVDKPMRDADIGDYKAPGLVLQRDMTRVGLEPIDRAAPGTEGIVDLYELPAYDDIASLFFYGNRWNLHFPEPGMPTTGNVRNTASKPITKEALRDVLDQITKNV